MRNYITIILIISTFLSNGLVSCQETIKTRTEDERLPIEFTEKLEEVKHWPTIYFKFDGACLQRKEISKDKYGKVITYYFELTKSKYIFLRHSTYSDFDAFENDEKMVTKKMSYSDIENINVIDLDFILDNGLKETYFTIRDKRIFLIDESSGSNTEKEFLVFEVVMGSSYGL